MYLIAGVDEVGRGAWAGPLVVGSVIIDPAKPISGIKDSKKLSPINRERISSLLWQDHDCSIGIASVDEINKLGLNPATFLAIERALSGLSKVPEVAFIDGNYQHQFKTHTVNIIRGEDRSISIAAASIIAKVYRDNIMKSLADDFPNYGWQGNVGYGAPAHVEGSQKYGCCLHHRINYKPIAEILLGLRN